MPEREEEEAAIEGDDEGGARAFWSGTISFGLVSIPVQLLSAHRPRAVALRSLAPDGTPLRRQLVCPDEEEPVDGDDVVRGWDAGDGEWVVMSEEELESLEPERSRDIDLRRFVPRDEVDAVYFERAYYLAPDGGTLKAYRLLAETLEELDVVGIATFVLRGREHVVMIMAAAGVMKGVTLRFASELRGPEEAGLPVQGRPDAAALKRFQAAIDEQALEALPLDLLRDETAEALLARAREKHAKGEDVVELGEEVRGGGDEAEEDIVEVLRRSLHARETERRSAG